MDASRRVTEIFLRCLDDSGVVEPMNRLIVWTELGKGLAGTLDRKGADIGLLGRVIEGWCDGLHLPAADLGRWAYRVEPARRLSQGELGETLARAHAEIDGLMEPIAQEAGEDGGRAPFLAVVRGWFAAGRVIIAAFPAAAGADDATCLAALRAWCARYLPRDPAGASELGVRVER